jgi:very-short-patch-repair endonuclease
MRGVVPLTLYSNASHGVAMRGSKPDANARSRRLRRNSTDAEDFLWSALRNRSLNGYKFVRQAPIGNYFADFLCREKLLIVEADGSQHQDNTHDDIRDSWLIAQGYSILRLGNAGILARRHAVLDTIVEALEGRLAAQESVEMKLKLPLRG